MQSCPSDTYENCKAIFTVTLLSEQRTCLTSLLFPAGCRANFPTWRLRMKSKSFCDVKHHLSTRLG